MNIYKIVIKKNNEVEKEVVVRAKNKIKAIQLFLEKVELNQIVNRHISIIK